MAKPTTHNMLPANDEPGPISVFLLTRFAVQLTAIDWNVPADPWLQERLRLFRDVAVPSVAAQSKQPDSWIVFVDGRVPTWALDQLTAALSQLPFASVHQCDGHFTSSTSAGAVEGLLRGHERAVVTTRMDSDDAVASGFLARVLELATSALASGRDLPFFVNLDRGLQYRGGRVYHRYDPSNAFVSYVERTGGIRTVHLDEHQRLRELGHMVHDRRTVGWLQVVHDSNIANEIHGIRADPTLLRLFSTNLEVSPVTRLTLATQATATAAKLGLRVLGSRHRRQWLRAVLSGGSKSESAKAVTYCIYTAALPRYRQEFIQSLTKNLSPKLMVLCGPRLLGSNIPTGISRDLYTPIRALYLLRGRVLLQLTGIRTALGATTLIVDLNPRILTSWVFLIARKTLRRRTLVWGHVYPRAGADARTRPLRDFMRSLADGMVVYTYSDAESLSVESPTQSVWVGANALYPAREIRAAVNARRSSVLYVGRLDADKKPHLLLDAFVMALDDLEPTTSLIFAGTGDLRNTLEAEARRVGIPHRVRFTGATWNVDELRRLYAEAICAVSPGYAGLSLTQSAGFGVPLVVADGERHAPEIEIAAVPDAVVFFQAGSARDLARTLVLPDLRLSNEARARLSESIRSRYSTERMVDGFVSAFEDRARFTTTP